MFNNEIMLLGAKSDSAEILERAKSWAGLVIPGRVALRFLEPGANPTL